MSESPRQVREGWTGVLLPAFAGRIAPKSSSAGWSHTIEDVFAQPRSLSAKLVRRSWMAWDEALVGYVPGVGHNWEGIDPGLVLEVSEGTL